MTVAPYLAGLSAILVSYAVAELGNGMAIVATSPLNSCFIMALAFRGNNSLFRELRIETAGNDN